MSDSKKKPERRDFLFTATYAVGAVGAAAVVWPMIDQMNPDASVKALASTEVDVSSVQPGNTITVLWRGKPVFIRRRTQEEIDEARAVKMEELIHPEKDEDRAKNPEWLVMLGVCTHLGCVPLNDKGDYNGWFCPCHDKGRTIHCNHLYHLTEHSLSVYKPLTSLTTLGFLLYLHLFQGVLILPF